MAGFLESSMDNYKVQMQAIESLANSEEVKSDGMMSPDGKAEDDGAIGFLKSFSEYFTREREDTEGAKPIVDVPEAPTLRSSPSITQSDIDAFTSETMLRYPAQTDIAPTKPLDFSDAPVAKQEVSEPAYQPNEKIGNARTTDRMGLMSQDTVDEETTTTTDSSVSSDTPSLMEPPAKKVETSEADKPIKNEFIVSEVDAAPVPFSQNGRSGPAKGITKTFSVNGEERNITDVFETTKTMKPWKNQSGNVDVKNVVLHWTETEYKHGVRHFLNSFESHNNVTAAFFIDKEGNIFQNFDPTKKGAHVAGSKSKNPYGIIKNDNSIGIEVEGISENPPTEKAKKATAWLTNYIMGKYGAENVYAHPQANVHKGDVEGFDLLNAWRESRGLDPIIPKKGSARDNLYTGE